MVKDSLPTQTKIFSLNTFFRPEIWIKREGSETGIIQKLDPSLETKKMGQPRGAPFAFQGYNRYSHNDLVTICIK